MGDAKLIKWTSDFKEGEIINKWIHSRMIKNNKNILTATTGPTGSGKSYQDLRKAELWYRFYFNKEFPVENICFSVEDIIKRISSGELKKGEILIFEEAGANLGSLDFQNKLSKMFTYVLQTFRSLNVGIFFNLPYLSMLNKQARMLIHAHFVTNGIDHELGVAKSRGYFLQINQSTGKVYNKNLRVKKNGIALPIKSFSYRMPSKELADAYEKKKYDFIINLTKDFKKEIENINNESKIKNKNRIPGLTRTQSEVYAYLDSGMTGTEISEEMGTTPSNIYSICKKIRDKGIKLPKEIKEIEEMGPAINL
jgi:DNA-binding CsgD family transcriptional regulator